MRRAFHGRSAATTNFTVCAVPQTWQNFQDDPTSHVRPDILHQTQATQMAELNPRSVAIKNPTFSESVKLVLFARSHCQFGLRPCVVQAAGRNNAWNLRRPLYIRLWGDNSSLRLVFSNMCLCLCFPCNLTSIPPHAPPLPSTSQFFCS